MNTLSPRLSPSSSSSITASQFGSQLWLIQRVVALVVGIDHPVVVEGEQEGMAIFDVAASSASTSPWLQQALYWITRSPCLIGATANTVAVDGGLAGLDLLGHGKGWFAAMELDSRPFG
jgi:hypothetical protein